MTMFMESSSSVFMLFLSFVISKRAQKPGNRTQKHYFIRSLIKSVFTYNFELWCNSATKKQINMMTGKFKKRNFDVDMDFYLCTMIRKTAFKFISDPSHILHGRYKTKRFDHQMLRAASLDF